MDLPETRYARSGAVNIAYEVTGQGPFRFDKRGTGMSDPVSGGITGGREAFSAVLVRMESRFAGYEPQRHAADLLW